VVAAVPGAWAGPSRRLEDPFTLGVASGDPTPTGVVLWTRLAPRPLEPDGGMPAWPVPVQWEVATGPRIRNVVRPGVALAHPRFVHSVHVDVEGLEPGRIYWCPLPRRGLREPSWPDPNRAGPGAGAGQADPGLRLLPALGARPVCGLAAPGRRGPDVVLHLGDYIYEGPGRGGVRRHVGREPTTLAGYRVRHALYKTDPDLQAAHGRPPFVVIWDDHEVENDHAGPHRPTGATRPPSPAAERPPTAPTGSICPSAAAPRTVQPVLVPSVLPW
jgi:alkaline phosphatase D